MKKTQKFGLQILLLALMVFTLFGCGTRSTDLSSAQNDETDLEETSTKQPDDKDDAESQSQHGENMEVIDELWEKLDGVWRQDAYTPMIGERTTDEDATVEFQYIDGNPRIVRIFKNYDDEYYTREYSVYEGVKTDESHYNVYTYKKGSYNVTNSPWDDDISLFGYEFDLTNISNGELLIKYQYYWVNGNIDTELYEYHKED